MFLNSLCKNENIPMLGKHIDAKPNKLLSTLPRSLLKSPLDSLDEHLQTKQLGRLYNLTVVHFNPFNPPFSFVKYPPIPPPPNTCIKCWDVTEQLPAQTLSQGRGKEGKKEVQTMTMIVGITDSWSLPFFNSFVWLSIRRTCLFTGTWCLAQFYDTHQ